MTLSRLSKHMGKLRAGLTLLSRRASGGDTDVIDVRDIVARHDFAEHAERADRYFSTLDFNSAIARKPFAAPFEAAEICGGLSALLPDLLLFPGARVLDFGAGTCWMSRLLALLGCEVTAVDVSRKALEVGERLIRADALGDRLRVEFVPLDGPDLPFADGTFDRVVCFDALHHVPDQQRAVREFARVLKQGGIAALHEPGPRNSQTPQAQFEMRMYGVIEGDVHVEELIAAGRDAGFTDAELVVYSGRAIRTGLSGFGEFLANPGGSRVGRELVAQTAAVFENRRTVLLHKGDALAAIDSRSPLGLLAAIDVDAWADDRHTHVRGTVTNTGASTWLPSFTGVGAVNIGVHLHRDDGAVADRDYGRFRLSGKRIVPGQTESIEMSIPHPEGMRRFGLAIDLVAEGILWFEIGGSTPARFEIILDETSPRVERK